MLDKSTFPIPPAELLELARRFILTKSGLDDPSILADDFQVGQAAVRAGDRHEMNECGSVSLRCCVCALIAMAERLQFIFPFVGPLSKTEFLAAVSTFSFEEAFPDLKQNTRMMSVRKPTRPPDAGTQPSWKDGCVWMTGGSVRSTHSSPIVCGISSSLKGQSAQLA